MNSSIHFDISYFHHPHAASHWNNIPFHVYPSPPTYSLILHVTKYFLRSHSNSIPTCNTVWYNKKRNYFKTLPSTATDFYIIKVLIFKSTGGLQWCMHSCLSPSVKSVAVWMSFLYVHLFSCLPQYRNNWSQIQGC